MFHIHRAVEEIQTSGLFARIHDEICLHTNTSVPSSDQIQNALEEHPELLEEYKQINVENNLTNLHQQKVQASSPITEDLASVINSNLDRLKDLEKYTLDFEQSPVLIFIFSIEFFLLFSVQYMIVLLDLKSWQIPIYATFASSIFAAWIYAKHQRKLYQRKNLEFEELYAATLSLLERFDQLERMESLRAS
jgi:hypothetical protein